MKLLTSLIVGAFFVFGAVSAQAQSGDFASALLKEWLPLAEQGNADAQFDLGFMYENGTGVLQDYAEAVKWYRLSAEQGNAEAQYSLGFMYSSGTGVIHDYAEALKWYRLAAEQGNANAQYNLGVLYKYGGGVAQDNISSHMWYNIASANGNKEASQSRDKIAAKMTTADVLKAQAMAKECMNSGYKNCGW